MTTFRGNGKLLITGEYAVLDGALALAVPTRKGQSLTVKSEPHPSRRIEWKSFRHDQSLWFEAHFDKNFAVLYTSDDQSADTLRQVLSAAVLLNPEFLIGSEYYEVTTHLEFDEKYGLGSSSTLIHNIAKWAQVNPYELLFMTFKGSGYDIACADADSSIFYRLQAGEPIMEPSFFSPHFQNQLYFVYLNKKQNSREGIARYRNVNRDKTDYIKRISELSRLAANAETIATFEDVLNEHESITSKLLGIPRVCEQFRDFPGAVKSLGAWGGDFILACGDDAPSYFKQKGFPVIMNWDDIVLE